MKVINTVTNKVVRVIGKEENLRYLNLSLYQGAPAKKGLTTLAMAASANPLLQEKATRDPHLFCTAFKKSRFYLFGKSGESVVPPFVSWMRTDLAERQRVGIEMCLMRDRQGKIRQWSFLPPRQKQRYRRVVRYIPVWVIL